MTALAASAGSAESAAMAGEGLFSEYRCSRKKTIFQNRFESEFFFRGRVTKKPTSCSLTFLSSSDPFWSLMGINIWLISCPCLYLNFHTTWYCPLTTGAPTTGPQQLVPRQQDPTHGPTITGPTTTGPQRLVPRWLVPWWLSHDNDNRYSWLLVPQQLLLLSNSLPTPGVTKNGSKTTGPPPTGPPWHLVFYSSIQARPRMDLCLSEGRVVILK